MVLQAHHNLVSDLAVDTLDIQGMEVHPVEDLVCIQYEGEGPYWVGNYQGPLGDHLENCSLMVHLFPH